MFFEDPKPSSSSLAIKHRRELRKAKDREELLKAALQRYAEHAWPEIERKLKEMT